MGKPKGTRPSKPKGGLIPTKFTFMLRPGLERVVGEMDCPPLAGINDMRLNVVDDIWVTFQPVTRDKIRLIAHLPKGTLTQEIVLQATRDTRTGMEDLIRRLDRDDMSHQEDEARDSVSGSGSPGEDGAGDESVPTEAEEQAST